MAKVNRVRPVEESLKPFLFVRVSSFLVTTCLAQLYCGHCLPAPWWWVFQASGLAPSFCQISQIYKEFPSILISNAPSFLKTPRSPQITCAFPNVLLKSLTWPTIHVKWTGLQYICPHELLYKAVALSVIVSPSPQEPFPNSVNWFNHPRSPPVSPRPLSRQLQPGGTDLRGDREMPKRLATRALLFAFVNPSCVPSLGFVVQAESLTVWGSRAKTLS